MKFPHVKVELIGHDGNAFAVLGATMKAMRRAKVSKEDIDKYRDEATSGDYNHPLAVTMATVDVS